jgi:hypothetical protein
MSTKTLFVALATAVIGLAALSPSRAATFGTYGDTFNNGTAFDLTSYSGSGSGYSGMYIIPSGGLILGAITQLSADYNMLTGTFAGGAPRFGIADSSGHQVWVYWGTGSGSYSNPNANGVWANTGNYADLSSPDVRVYSNGFGGYSSTYPGETWADLLGHAGLASESIWYIVLDLDAGFAGDQHMLVDNFTVNGDVFAAVSAVPLPAGLPLFVSGCAALGLISWRRKRRAALVA